MNIIITIIYHNNYELQLLQNCAWIFVNDKIERMNGQNGRYGNRKRLNQVIKYDEREQ